MRIQNGTSADAVQNQGTNLVQNQATNAVQNQAVQNQGAPALSGSSDRVALSKASTLVSLAKGMMPADKQAKFEAIQGQFNAGTYQFDPSGVGRAVVQSHT